MDLGLGDLLNKAYSIISGDTGGGENQNGGGENQNGGEEQKVEEEEPHVEIELENLEQFEDAEEEPLQQIDEEEVEPEIDPENDENFSVAEESEAAAPAANQQANQPTTYVNLAEKYNITFDSSELESSSDEAKKLVLVFQILINAATQLSLINTDDGLEAFTDTFGWLSILTLGFDFSDEDLNYAQAVAVLTMPVILFMLFCYIKQRPKFDIERMSREKRERYYFYGSLVIMVTFCVSGVGFTYFVEDKEFYGTPLITLAVVSFCIMFALMPFWFFRVIVFSEFLSADSRTTFESLEVWTIQLFFGTLLIPVLSLALRLGEGADDRIIARDEGVIIPKIAAGFVTFILFVMLSFVASGAPANNALPDLPLKYCVCEMASSPGFCAWVNSWLYFKSCCKSSESVNIRRKPPYPWPFTQRPVDPSFFSCYYESSRWWFPFFVYGEQITIALMREYIFFRGGDELSFLISLSSVFFIMFLIVYFAKPYNAEKRHFLWVADLFSRFYIFGISILILIAVAYDDPSSTDELLLGATIMGLIFIVMFFISGGLVRLAYNSLLACCISSEVRKHEDITEDDNSLEQVDALFPPNQPKPFIDYRVWRYLTQNQRLYLLATIKPKKKFLEDFAPRGCTGCPGGFLTFNADEDFTWSSSYRWLCTLLGQYTLTKFEKSFIDFRATGYNKIQYLLQRGLEGLLYASKLNKLEFYGAHFTEGTWRAVAKLAGVDFNKAEVGNEAQGSRHIHFSIETIMFTDCTFDDEAWLEFRKKFLRVHSVQRTLKSLAFFGCTINNMSRLKDEVGNFRVLEKVFIENLKGIESDPNQGINEILFSMNENDQPIKIFSAAGSPFDSTLMCRAVCGKFHPNAGNSQWQVKLGEIEYNYFALLALVKMRSNLGKLTVFEATIAEHAEPATNRKQMLIWNSLKALVLQEKLIQDAVSAATADNNRSGLGRIFRSGRNLVARASNRGLNNRAAQPEDYQNCFCLLRPFDLCCRGCLNETSGAQTVERYDRFRTDICGCCIQGGPQVEHTVDQTEEVEDGEMQPVNLQAGEKKKGFFQCLYRLALSSSTADSKNILRFHFSQGDFDEERAIMADYYATSDLITGCGTVTHTKKGREAEENASHPFFILADERERFDFLKGRLANQLAQEYTNIDNFIPQNYLFNGGQHEANFSEEEGGRAGVVTSIESIPTSDFIQELQRNAINAENHV